MSTATLSIRRIGRVRPLAMLPPSFRRRVLFALTACLVLAAGYQFWLRDSSFVAVEKVTVSGLTTKDANRVRAALTSAAHDMTTLHVKREELEQAIVAYPVVRALEVSPDFPHGLRIHVVEHRPAALVGGLPVAGDGTILRGLPVEGRLPTIPARGNLHGTRLKDPISLHAALVAGGAPAALRSRLEQVEMRGEDGLVVGVRDGPELIFGDATRVHAKWLAAARVLADPDAAGATYIDVRLPGRPAAGGLPAETLAPVAPAGAALMAPPTAAAPTGTAVDPATEPLAPASPDPAQQSAPESAAAPAPTSAQPAPAPADTTAAGGASPPPG
ncbi:MAG TPA: FtsQ-type POTRA domain-containing protein [Thermoleophilaceae bacterium]|jgi:cell division protein FtsQ|nr:FtsQ-type POTRA domain-containing protein [Thermoleophilaceae bacterium]